MGTVHGFWVNGLMDIVGQPHLLNLLQVRRLHHVFPVLSSCLCMFLCLLTSTYYMKGPCAQHAGLVREVVAARKPLCINESITGGALHSGSQIFQCLSMALPGA